MSHKTNIEWCDSTWNPWEGCQKVGPGCDHCYAETRNARFAGGLAVNWGPGAPRRRTSAANWRKPLAWNRGHSTFFSQHGRRQRVFCASLADVFDNQVVGDWRRDLATLIMMTPNLDWLLLTKRIGNAGAMLADMFPAGTPEHVWIGATIVNQEEADRDIPKLLDTPARVRFLSIEPLLGPVNVARYMWPIHGWWKGPYNSYREAKAAGAECGLKRQALVWAHARFIDWVIVGGESGPGARPMHPDWARSLRDQCAAAGVPFLFKQWGEWRPISQMADAEHSVLYRSRVKARAHEDQNVLDDIYGRDCSVPTGIVHNNGTLLNIDEPMACRHGSGAMQIFKVGKKAAGRLLDGIQHDGFPI